MFKFKIWVDADSFPQKAREELLKLAKLNEIPVFFVANHEIKSNCIWEGLNMVVCAAGEGVADDYIVSNSADNDIVVTRDIPLAARLVEKRIKVLNDRGTVFDKNNIEDRLREREFSLNLAAIGLGGGKSNYYGEKELKKFVTTLEQAVQTHKMNETYNIKKY